MRTSALLVIISFYIMLCLASCGYSMQGSIDTSLDISKATDEADFIVVGGHPSEERCSTILGKPGPVSGYRIDAIRFIKGADTVSVSEAHNPKWPLRPGVSISAEELRNSSVRAPIVPMKSGENDQFIYFLVQKYNDDLEELVPIAQNTWFVSATPENIHQVELFLQKVQNWGKPSNGLAAGVRTFKQSYFVGEPVRLELHLKNVSNHTLFIPQHRPTYDDYYPFLHFSGEMESPASYALGRNNNLTSVYFEKTGKSWRVDALNTVKLEPGQVYVDCIYLDHWMWHWPYRLQINFAGARFKLHGCLSVGELDKDFKYSKEENDAMWKGTLEIPTFNIYFQPWPDAWS